VHKERSYRNIDKRSVITIIKDITI